MKASINQWVFPPDMPAAQAISLARKIGFEAIELCADETTCVRLDTSEKDLAALRKHAEREDIELVSIACGLGWKYPLSSLDAATRGKGREVAARSIEIAHVLGAKSVLLVPGVVNESTDYSAVFENALSSVQDLVRVAEKRGVIIGVENVWNKFLLSPLEMRDFIDSCESDSVGAYFDTGNILAYGYPEQWIRILGRRICAVHAKDFRTAVGNINGFVMLLEGDVNWPAVVTALREAGFDGALTAEYGAYKHSLEATLRHIRESLETIIRM